MSLVGCLCHRSRVRIIPALLSPTIDSQSQLLGIPGQRPSKALMISSLSMCNAGGLNVLDNPHSG